jgi:FkbM family methyltransferase
MLAETRIGNPRSYRSKVIEILSGIGNRIGKPPGWERIVRMLVSPEECRRIAEVCVVRDGMLFLAQPAVPIDWYIMFFGTYEPEVRQIFRAVLSARGVALDIGANVGWHTLLMARLVGKDGRVLAAEANPTVRTRLQENLRLNRFANVELIPYAMMDSEGTAEFYDPAADNGDSGSGYIVTNSPQSRRGIIPVETRQVDSVISAARIERLDLIKIDVEGFEWAVLQGGTQTIGKFRPHIIFEYNAEYSSRAKGDQQVLAEFFHKHRYRLFTIRRSWAELVRPGNWPTCAEIWAVPAD